MLKSNSAFDIEGWLEKNESILNLDPLNFDEKLPVLHLLNKAGDTHEIIQLLYRTLPVPDALERYSYNEAIAAMRDLGIFIGILKKLGIEPVQAIPELEYVLLVLMVKTDLPPRDTLIHYTVWNPEGSRIRTYTGLPDEMFLIQSVKIAMPDLMRAILQTEELLCSKDLDILEFEMICHEIRIKMESMVKGIVHARRLVSPEVFYKELRFYYDPIKIDYNKDYIGPGAVEMPMYVFDHLLWSSDCVDKEYTSFKEGYLPYTMRFVRDTYWRFKDKPSLLTQVEQALLENPDAYRARAAQVVLDLCTVLKSFRMPHKKLAEEAYAHGDKTKENSYSTGSGGYSTDILQRIIQLQNSKINNLQMSLSQAKVMR